MRSLPVFTLLLVAAITAFGQKETPQTAARTFYNYDRAHSSDAFDRRSIDERRGWFSKDLYALFEKELKREDSFLKKHPNDKPYFGDGLPFQPIDETCKIGRSSVHKKLTLAVGEPTTQYTPVLATFSFPRPCKDPDTTIYKVRMVQSKGGWVIDDLEYEDGHTLRQDLNRKDY